MNLRIPARAWSSFRRGLLVVLMFSSRVALSAQEPAGSIRGVVYDKDFDTALADVRVVVVETGASAQSGDQGNYVIAGVPPGRYTLVFTREGYQREVQPDVLVAAGRLTDVDAWLTGEFTDLEEFLVQDVVQLGTGSEAGLLQLRLESPALMDSISAELMSRAGASDAASALRLVAGASVQDGKSAVIRGLPDRYVNSQLNGVRLPTADEDKRAVELDQFPAAVIESVQVSKTFTPDQQGDASGGAVNVRLKGIPEETVFSIRGQFTYDTHTTGEDDFLTYRGGGVNFLGIDDGGRDIQTENIGGNWTGAAGVSTDDAPLEYKMSVDAGKKFALSEDVTIGGFASAFYESDSTFYDDGINDSLWVDNPGEGLTPKANQGTPSDGDFKTALYDVTQGTQLVQWGGLATLGLESEAHRLGFTALYTRTAEDKATLAQDTRGKEFFFPGYDPDDPTAPGNESNTRRAAPWNRTETLQYTERTTTTLQLDGQHELPSDGFRAVGLDFKRPELDWGLASSVADLDQPDKRQFGSLFLPESFNPALPGVEPPLWVGLFPSSNVNLGNFQRIWKDIEEKSQQYALDLKLPFTQWDGHEGYFQGGLFADHLERTFDQDTFSNFGDSGASFDGDFDDFWSSFFPSEDHAITESLFDVDYEGDQRIAAWYGMIDMPLAAKLDVIGGARFESTDLSIVNFPEENAFWFPEGATQPQDLEPGEADVDFHQDDVLPSIGLVYEPLERLTLRASYGETVARQTFKELTPILQQEFEGAPVFIGNPDLGMSAIDNYDLRLDYTPYEGALVSLSWFHKEIEDPIEYIQRPTDFTFTTAVNYPEGKLGGYEIEARQRLERFWPALEGVGLGANATFIDSEVTLPDDEVEVFEQLQVPITKRDMTNAPDHLYNLYLTYDIEESGTQFAIFYTVEGDTLVAGAGESQGNFIPSIYAKEFGTLNLSFSQLLGPHLRLQLQAKNITDPEIEEVYRSEFTGGDTTRTSYTKGSEYSIGLTFVP